MKYFNKVYIVTYSPNCEEDYIVFISFFRKDCLEFIKKHSDLKNKYYTSYELSISKYYLKHWYRNY